MEHVGKRVDGRAEIERFGVQRLPAPEREQPLRQVGALLGGRHHQFGRRLQLRIGDLFVEDLRVAEDHREEIVEVVRDAAGQMAERLHLLRLAQLRRHLDAFRFVGKNADEMRGRAALVADRRDRQVVPERLAVLAVVQDGAAEQAFRVPPRCGSSATRFCVGVGALQEARVAADGFFLRVAGEPLEGRVDVGDRRCRTPPRR